MLDFRLAKQIEEHPRFARDERLLYVQPPHTFVVGEDAPHYIDLRDARNVGPLLEQLQRCGETATLGVTGDHSVALLYGHTEHPWHAPLRRSGASPCEAIGNALLAAWGE